MNYNLFIIILNISFREEHFSTDTILKKFVEIMQLLWENYKKAKNDIS